MTAKTNSVSTPEHDDEHSLRRVLTLPLLTLYGLGVTVGAGIYVLVGATAAEAGAYAPFAFLVAAMVVAFTAFSYAELATRYPVSAGEAVYVEAGFKSNRLAAAVGLLVALSGIVSASAVSIGAASYLSSLTNLPEALLTIAVIGLMGIIAFWGIAQSVTVAAIITVIEIGGLILVISWGFGAAEPTGVSVSDMLPTGHHGQWAGIAAASLLAFFAFVGFEDMANVAEEVKDPVRTIPKAIIWTLVSASLLYIGTTVAVLYSVPMEELVGSAAPLSLVFADASEGLRNAFSSIAIVATVNGVLIQMIMASRVIYGLADRGHLPSWLAGVSVRTRTPGPATAIVVLAIVLLTQLAPIDELARYTSQIVLIVFILVNLALIRLKSLGASDADHFSVPVLVPVCGVVSSLALLATELL